jgi:hypothetical protein
MRRLTLQLAAVWTAKPVRALALACVLLIVGWAAPAQAADRYW